jgi:hypothetical protein
MLLGDMDKVNTRACGPWRRCFNIPTPPPTLLSMARHQKGLAIIRTDAAIARPVAKSVTQRSEKSPQRKFSPQEPP